jgi:cytochrome c2
MALVLMPGTTCFAAPGGDPTAGRTAFAACQGCHSVSPGRNGVGPSLSDVLGRQAGSVNGYGYSSAMKSAHVDWDPATLDRFLANPQSVVHGTKMFANVPNETTRQNIIAYLSTLKQ